VRRVSRCPVSVQPSFCCYFLGCVFAAHKSGEKRQGTAEDRVLFEFVGGSVLTNRGHFCFSASRLFFRAILKKPSRSFDKSAVLATSVFLPITYISIFTHQLVCTVICDKLPWGRFAIFRCFRWVWVLGGCVCWVSVCLWGFGCFAPCLGSLRCLIVSSCSPWVFSVAHRRSIPTAFGLTVKALFCLRVHLISPSAGGTGRRY